MRSSPDRISHTRVAFCRAIQLYISYCYEIEADGGDDAPSWRREALFAEAAMRRINARLEMIVVGELGGSVSETFDNAGVPPSSMIAPKLYTRLQAALLSAFDEAGLRRMVRLEMDVDLDAVAGGDDMQERVFNLISWAARTNRVAELIAGAQNQNAHNGLLVALTEK